VVAPGHPDAQHAGAVPGDPFEFGADPVALRAHAAPEDRRVDVEAAQNLGKLGDVPEAVRDVADLHHPAVIRAHAMAEHQVADQRLRADQVFIRQDVPRPDADTPGLRQALQDAGALRAHFQVILQD